MGAAVEDDEAFQTLMEEAPALWIYDQRMQESNYHREECIAYEAVRFTKDSENREGFMLDELSFHEERWNKIYGSADNFPTGLYVGETPISEILETQSSLRKYQIKLNAFVEGMGLALRDLENELKQSKSTLREETSLYTEACSYNKSNEPGHNFINPKGNESETVSVYGKYKPVALKVRPQLAPMPEEFRIERNITGDPLAGMPELNTNPPEFISGGRYTEERRDIIDKNHGEDFLWPEERKLVHHLMKIQEKGFAWCAEEGGTFRTDFFPPIKFPVLPHKPWVERNIPIPPGIYEEVCGILRDKMAAGVYEPSTSSYRSKWFMVLKKDGKSLRLVHSLEPLNKVTIQHSGIPPGTAEIAGSFSGRACIGMLDIWVRYDERLIHDSSRDLTTFQTPFGPYRLVKLPMGWTNSVPVFHEDVTYILRDEIPHVTRPYIDDVPVRGPSTRYELPGGKYETIPENSGI